MYHDVGLGLCSVACNCNVTDNGQRREACYIIVALNLVSEEVDDEQYSDWNSKTKNKCNEKYDSTLRAYLAIELRFVNQLTLIGCGSNRDAAFLTLL